MGKVQVIFDNPTYVLSYHDKYLVDNDFPFIQIQTLIFHSMCSYRLHNPAISTKIGFTSK